MVPAEGPPELVWDEYFETNKPDPLAVCEVVQKLHKARKREQAIACLNAALIHGLAHPLMYEVLALEMKESGRPPEEIERVLLSTVDFSAVNLANILHSAAVLTSFGAKDRALALYRQASAVDPSRLEPYALGLKLARDAHDSDAVAWAASGILQRAWSPGFEALHRDATATAREVEAEVRQRGEDAAADRLARSVAEALQRDLVIELSWSGKADLDLLVEEPAGTICSAESPVTAGGGIFIHDGYGGDLNDCHDNYVCPQGLSGDYRVTVRHISGDVVGKRGVLKIVRYQGTVREIEERFTVQLSDRDKVVRVTLTRGRMKEPGAVPILEDSRNQPGASRRVRRERLVGGSRESQRAGAEFVEGRTRAFGGPGAPGYQPVITVLQEGVSNTAMAVISGDRRYVRLTMQPMFTAITDVKSFSFFTQGGTTNSGGGTGTGSGR